jgi:tetratricopeptide (TPR) repeat protein
MKKESKAYPYLKALLDGLIEAAPNWAKAPGKFCSSLSEQLKKQREEENKKLEKEIESISKDELRELIKEAGSEQKADLEFIVENIELIAINIKAVPEILRAINYRFDKVNGKLEEIKGILRREKPSFTFPLEPSLHNQTPPEENFVGREEELKTITDWYKNPDVRIGALIGWGGVGKSALVRKWYDSLEANNIKPDGIFWWGFYRNAYLERFLDEFLRYVSGGQIKPEEIKGTWEKVDRIKEHINQGAYLIVLDGLEEMQKGQTSGEEFGCMEHKECAEMLKYLADTKGDGLCLITTRYPLTDIKNYEGKAYRKKDIERLSIEDGRRLFEKRGVKGSQEEIDSVIEEYDGHALSLTLLAGYLVEDYGGDIKKAKEIPPFYSDKEAGGKAHRILLWYAKQLTEEQRVFMKIFSLFRRAVCDDDLGGVFQARMETEMNQALKEMTEFTFKRMVDNLVDRRLISRDKDNTYATHPLIKNYFESIFDEEDKKLCHKRIYEYIGEYAPERPETLEEMQPLFEQVYHGCAAGLYDETVHEVFYAKIHRYQEHLIAHKLGAWETDLSLAKTFFPEGDLSKMPFVNKKSDQSWLFNEVGLVLLNTGRPKEAEGPLKATIKLYIEENKIAFTSVGYQNLTDLQFRMGEIEVGLDSAKEALDLAERAKSDRYIILSKGYLGWGLYLLGKTEEADKDFKAVDELEIKIGGVRLYSQRGVNYATFLISMERIDEAVELTRQNLEICRRNNFVNSIARCHRCLGAVERIKGDKKQAEKHIQDALEIARKVGQPSLEIEALIERGRLWLDTGRYEDAIDDSKQVLKICKRTGFRLYEPEAEIVLGKAYLARKNFEKAEANALSAYEKALEMKYRWAEGDAGHLLGEIYSAKGEKKEAKEWIRKAVKCRKGILDPKVKESEAILERIS